MNNEFVESDQQKVKMLNLYFFSQNQVDDTIKDLPYLDQAPHTLESIIISSQDVKDTHHHLNTSKASGPDLISPAFSKKELIYLLYHTHLFSTFPLIRDTKGVNVSHFYKNDDKSLPSNYRPISPDAKLEKQWNDVSINICTTICI